MTTQSPTPAALHGVTERSIRVGGFLTRYLEAGDPKNDPILLIHDGAWGASSDVTWGSFIPELADKYYVLAPDLLGYGGSDKAVFVDRAPHDPRIAQLSEFVKALNVTKPIHLVGNSFGGATALRALAKAGSFNFRSVVSIAGSGGPGRTQLAIEQLGRWDGTRDDLARVLALLVDADYPGFEDQLSARFASASTPGHYKAVMAPTAAVPDVLKQAVEDPWPAQIAATMVPILLVRCLRDVLLESDWAVNVKAGVAHAEIVEIDCRHSPQLDHPAEFKEALFAFFARQPELSA